MKATDKQQKFVDDYLRTRAESNRVPGTKDVIIADCTEENVNWLRDMRGKRRSTADDLQAVSDLCRAKLELADAKLPSEYSYRCLPLCVIDAVFSIGVTYACTRNVVKNFCGYCSGKLNAHCSGMSSSSNRDADTSTCLSLERLLEWYERLGCERMAKDVFQNRQRTSSRSGILKSEAVLRFARVLCDLDVHHLPDAKRILDCPDFEHRIHQIPGQSSGVSIQYFYMLCGSEDHVKPDRRVLEFVSSAVGRKVATDDASDLVVLAAGTLKREYPQLTPRNLDYLIWCYQGAQPASTEQGH